MRTHQFAQEQEENYVSPAATILPSQEQQLEHGNMLRHSVKSFSKTTSSRDLVPHALAVTTSLILAKLVTTVLLAFLSKQFYEGNFFELDTNHVVAIFIFSLLLTALNAVGISYFVGLLVDRRIIPASLVVANVASSVCLSVVISPILYSHPTRFDSPLTWIVGLFSLATTTTIQILIANHVSRKHGKG